MSICVICKYFHAKCPGYIGCGLAYTAISDNTHGFASKFYERVVPKTEILAFTPTPILNGIIVVSYMMTYFQEERKNILCYGFGTIGRHIGDNDASLVRCLYVYNIKSSG